MAAYALVEDKQKCIDAGMTDYLSKPIDSQKFKDLEPRRGGRLIPQIKQLYNAPIIVVSGKASTTDRIVGLEMGARGWIYVYLNSCKFLCDLHCFF